jgi:DNA-binding LacI/PurR family transcriptional regulator
MTRGHDTGDDDDAPSPQKQRPRSPAGNVSLAAVAELAGVSEATVSRVLNRKYGVSATTREAVEAALRKIGYARPLRGELVVLLVPNLLDAIFASMCESIETEIAPYGLRAVVCPGTAQERDYVESLLDSGVAAVVFLSSSNTTRHSDPIARELLVSRGIPFIGVNGGFPDTPTAVFSTDDWRAAEIAVSHLYDLGHRRIGMCAGPVGNTPADRRVEGFVQAMDRRELPNSDDFVVRQYFGIEGGRHAADELLQLGVSAIVASSDDMALGAIRAIQRKGLKVPGDISVIGYNDSYMLDFTDPPLTTVRQPVDRIAENTTRAILALLANRELPLSEVLIEPEIRLRGSTGPVAR